MDDTGCPLGPESVVVAASPAGNPVLLWRTPGTGVSNQTSAAATVQQHTEGDHGSNEESRGDDEGHVCPNLRPTMAQSEQSTHPARGWADLSPSKPEGRGSPG